MNDENNETRLVWVDKYCRNQQRVQRRYCNSTVGKLVKLSKKQIIRSSGYSESHRMNILISI